jgi:hygromycin-B 7''-O-kinase
MTWKAPDFDGNGSLRAAADESRWARAAALAAERQGLSCAETSLFPTGSDVVIDCGAHVFKMTAPRWTDEIRTEHEVLARVHGQLGLDTPEPLAIGELDGWPYLLMSRLDGRALADVWPELDSGERRRLAGEMGELVARLHALPVAEEEAARWPEFLERMRRQAKKRLGADGATEDWAERVEPFLDALEPMSPRRPRLLHTEIHDQHVLVSERDGRWELSGLIDFADGRVGHPYYEVPALAEFIFQGERPLMHAFLRAYGLSEPALDDGLARELCGWSLLHRFGSLPRMLKAVGAPSPSCFGELALRLYGFD